MEGPRAARPDELAAVVELAGSVFGSTAPRDMGREYPALIARENLPRLRVFVDAGRPVALAGFTANRVATPVASFTVACIGSVCTLADVPRMAGLHRAEPVRFERSEPEWHAFLRTGQVTDRPCLTWVVSAPGRAESIEAYLCVQRTVETAQGRTASVQELAGSREAVVAALPHILDSMRADRVDVDVIGADGAMAALAARLGLEVVPRGFPGMVKVIDPPGLLPALRHLVGPGVSIAAGLDGFVFRLGAESFAVRGLEEVAAFLFGSTERQAAQPGPGALRSRLAAVLPVPLPDYGLNYI